MMVNWFVVEQQVQVVFAVSASLLGSYLIDSFWCCLECHKVCDRRQSSALGHWLNTCHKPLPFVCSEVIEQYTARSGMDSKMAKLVIIHISDGGEEDDEKVNNEACLVAQAPNEIFLGVDLKPDEWIKDSGCFKHMTGNRKLFSTYKAYNGGNVIFGSNLRGNIIGKGTISNDSLNIDNVEHVDNLGFNLLSIGQICDNKCRVTFSEHDSEITKDGKVIGRGIRKKGLYVMKLGNKPKDKICLATIDENSTLWHRRLGHANMRLIQSLASKELVRNLPKLKFDQHFCDACKIGKQAHASHKAKNIVSTTRCLELLHMDLFGPSAVRSYGGNRYTLVIVDDYSRKIKELLNVTFDETLPPSKTSPLVDDDLDEEEAIRATEKKNLENVVEDETLEIDEIVNIKESGNHPLENVIGNLNYRILDIITQRHAYTFLDHDTAATVGIPASRIPKNLLDMVSQLR
ncbi:retrovirus-related pol polyprotein from transposon TNT 1-94 [Tanacetum coccineum]